MRQDILKHYLKDIDISIHAPVKGATRYPAANARPGVISIHAPVKGATVPGPRRRGRHGNFNPRTREGCDSGRSRAGFSALGISIHAPVKGATPV